MNDINNIIKQLVLAHADNEIKAMAVVFTNQEGEPSIQYAVMHADAYAINFGMDIIKAGLMSDALNNASRPGDKRE